MRSSGRAGAATMIALVLSLSACSTESTPEVHPSPPPGVSLVDMTFVRDMMSHHLRMIGFAETLAADGSSPAARSAGRSIKRQETAELETLSGLYEGWTGEENEAAEGGHPHVSPPPPSLSRTGELRLIRRMIGAHFDGLLAAGHERAVGINPDARLTAKRIEKRIRSDTRALHRLLHEVRAS